MYILYMDESGVEELGAGTSHFVLLGLVIPAEEWKLLDTTLGAVKARYGLREQEIHTAWMHRRYSEQESVDGFETLSPDDRRAAAEAAIRRRAGIVGVEGSKKKIEAYRRESRAIRPYLHLTRAERLLCLEALAREISLQPDVRVFADAISKPDYVPGTLTPYEMAFEQVLTRFQAFLTAKHDIGIVVHDNNSKAAPRLTRLTRKFHAVGTLYREITNIVETPLFVDSSLTSMVQMADLCAFALRRLIENNEDRLWAFVEARGDRAGDRCVGIRHYTGRRACSCRVCRAHGRESGQLPFTTATAG
ncbi:MAG: DUF3800 domain-containing protein [Candidatus Bipolaricaulota bacterium]|nr:DUF3800 domain-containing protein [Candidatus Bipolaricaulota bacterium]